MPENNNDDAAIEAMRARQQAADAAEAAANQAKLDRQAAKLSQRVKREQGNGKKK
jgi:hypothetical protein